MHDGKPHFHEEGAAHTHDDGTAHVHGNDLPHGHVHTNTKVVKNRLARVIGHMHAVERMLDDERDCADVLVQLAAIRSALNNVRGAGQNFGQSYRTSTNAGDCSPCNICYGLLCADCLCECCGGDLIRCC